MNIEMQNNRALLCGEVFGALSLHFEACELENDGEGNYTGRTLIHRPSGVWAVAVELVEENEP